MEGREGCNPEKVNGERKGKKSKWRCPLRTLSCQATQTSEVGAAVPMVRLSNSSSETDSLSVGLGGLDLRLRFGRGQLGGSSEVELRLAEAAFQRQRDSRRPFSDLLGEKRSGAS